MGEHDNNTRYRSECICAGCQRSAHAGTTEHPGGGGFGEIGERRRRWHGCDLPSDRAAHVRAPLHRHSREDEWFYVLEGEFTAEIDGQRTILNAGGSAFAPRGAAHTLQNLSSGAVQMLVMVMVTPGAFQQFFEELSSLNKGLPAPDLVRTEQLARDFGIELLGPPLS